MNNNENTTEESMTSETETGSETSKSERTEKQKAASRANGAKSTGPVTEQGRLNSAGHNRPIGELSDTFVLEDESKDRFNLLLASLELSLQPENPLEAAYVENIAVYRWRLIRLREVEKAGMDYELRNQPSELSPPARAWLIMGSSRSHETRARSEARCERQIERSLERLYKLKAEAKKSRMTRL